MQTLTLQTARTGNGLTKPAGFLNEPQRLALNVYRELLRLKNIVTILLIVIPLLSAAQKQGNIWYFGDHAGVNFNSGSPVAIVDGKTYLCINQLHNEGQSVISDSAGTLLFYTNGEVVWNKNHQIMPNGSGLLGNISSTQSSIIVPMPKSERYYYIFTTDAWACGGTLNGLRYSVVDICADALRGDVISNEKNILLLDWTCEKVAVTRHANGNDYWILTHKFNSNEFYAFLLTSNGITDTVISAIGSVHSGSIVHSMGQLKFSPNGQRIAIGLASGAIGPADSLRTLDVFDFNKSTGVISNFLKL